jgi:D-sedoheptulose 7-phosphate isomerase
MDPDGLIRQRFADSAAVKRALAGDEHVAFTAALAGLIAERLRAGGKVLLCGNGGSAADATHLAAELVGRFHFDRPALAALSLSDNASAVTCIANDYDFDEVFARQVRAHGREGDVLIAISTSGGSPNVVRAVAAARELGLHTAAFTGADGGELADVCDLALRAPSDETPRIQEAHMLVGHTVCELVEAELFGSEDQVSQAIPSPSRSRSNGSLPTTRIGPRT